MLFKTILKSHVNKTCYYVTLSVVFYNEKCCKVKNSNRPCIELLYGYITQ